MSTFKLISETGLDRFNVVVNELIAENWKFLNGMPVMVNQDKEGVLHYSVGMLLEDMPVPQPGVNNG